MSAIELPRARAVGYLRALASALHTLAPNDDHVPLHAALVHLRALSPELSGGLLLPALVHPSAGLPDLAWLTRATAEQQLARRAPEQPVTPAELASAQRLDPELAERLHAREALHALLCAHDLLPSVRLVGALRRRRNNASDVVCRYDRVAPNGRWMRVTVDLDGTPRRGPVRVDKAGRVHLDPGLRHLLTRASSLPLLALKAQLEGPLTRVSRVSRGVIGPLWFPGVRLPAGVPEAAGGGVVLSASVEVLGDEVRSSVHQDPLRAPAQAPPGYGLYARRRFVATPAQIAPLTEWCHALGMPSLVEPLRPHTPLTTGAWT